MRWVHPDDLRTLAQLFRAGWCIGSRRVVLDGEIVAIGAGGQPDFVRLQNRIHRTRLTTALLRDVPVCLYLFDLLHLDGADLLTAPYLERREQLAVLGLEYGPIRVPEACTDLTRRRC